MPARLSTPLFTDLATLAGLGPHSRVLEIGCGTGQATLPLAQLGCTVVAMDLSPDMAAVARRNLAEFPNVTVVASAFEDWQPANGPFDAVLAATAFLFACITHLIEKVYNGQITKQYRTRLAIAHKTP